MKSIPWTISCTGLFTASLFASAGCDAQVDGDYAGEPLAVISGKIVNERTLNTPEAHAGLLWSVSYDSEQAEIYGLSHSIAETVNVSGEFPAQFRLELFQPPPEDGMEFVEQLGTRIAVAFIVASELAADELNQRITRTFRDDEWLSTILGAAENHLIVYAEAPTESAIIDDDILGPLQQGYNVIEATYLPMTPEEQEACLEEYETVDLLWYESYCHRAGPIGYHVLPTGLDTEIQVRMADSWEELLWP